MTSEQENAVDIATINATQVAMTATLARIEVQTTATNGRVTSLEAWRNRAVGAWFVMSLFGPIVTGVIVAYIIKQ